MEKEEEEKQQGIKVSGGYKKEVYKGVQRYCDVYLKKKFLSTFLEIIKEGNVDSQADFINPFPKSERQCRKNAEVYKGGIKRKKVKKDMNSKDRS